MAAVKRTTAPPGVQLAAQPAAQPASQRERTILFVFFLFLQIAAWNSID
jgi:hypothetical protein